jgi:hypothetical protein
MRIIAGAFKGRTLAGPTWAGLRPTSDKLRETLFNILGASVRGARVLDAYAGTYIIKLDVDEWGWRDSDLHDFDFDGIPVYFKLDAEGNPTGETVDGNAWGENIPENFAPVMDRFFHGD